MNRCIYMLITLAAVVTLIVAACRNSKLSNPESIPAGDPAHVVEHVLTSMGTGKIDDSKIIYSKDVVLFPVIHHYWENQLWENSHDVKFKIEEIRLSPYDANTQTVEYSCIVPHPGVAFWQWKPLDASELQNAPKGIPMKGRFTLIQEKDAGWRVKVEDNFNPIILYNRVVSSVTRFRYSLVEAEMRGDNVSEGVIRFHLAMLTAEYSISLRIPENDPSGFGKKVFKESMEITPR